MVLTLQDELGRRQRQLKIALFSRDPRRVEANESRRDQKGAPKGETIERREFHDFPPRYQGSGQWKIVNTLAETDDQAAMIRIWLERQRNGRNRHRRQQQDSEGIFKSAGEIEQRRKLQDVESQKRRRRPFFQTQIFRDEKFDDDVQDGGRCR